MNRRAHRPARGRRQVEGRITIDDDNLGSNVNARHDYPYTSPKYANLATAERPPCPFVHTSRLDGHWSRGTDSDVGMVVTASRTVHFKDRCRGCGDTSIRLPNELAIAWLDGAPVAWVRVNGIAEYDQCSIRSCPRPGTQRHHFAPRNRFGGDADDWPVLPLCPEHHLQWHQRMDGYRWQAQR